MLFRKKIERACSYCEFSTKVDDEQVLCSKKGLQACYGKCRKFTYDPCKRTPPKPKAPNFSQFNDTDFNL